MQTMQSVEGLPAEERARRYRDAADEISRMAETVRADDLRTAYRNLASRWAALAAEVERGIERQEVMIVVQAIAEARAARH